ncbi:hypothetical protein GCM10009555_065810 [Acrocarpospora macrocephala]|uniref:Uncharacterized protein n=1 Tax=Acrocarpospora macrocephala TaxID=150177 RepID=A0A5M3WVI7_9ACTN|nr:hypothetical protein [Acrocarpospora macrocephala]GES13435.1 hypothetical protein Amac_070320 [Acrocarpospora macrocephala]
MDNVSRGSLLVLAASVYVELGLFMRWGTMFDSLLLIYVTAPVSQILAFFPIYDLLSDSMFSTQIYILMYTAAGLFQAWLLWLIARGRKKTAAPVEGLSSEEERVRES